MEVPQKTYLLSYNLARLTGNRTFVRLFVCSQQHNKRQKRSNPSVNGQTMPHSYKQKVLKGNCAHTTTWMKRHHQKWNSQKDKTHMTLATCGIQSSQVCDSERMVAPVWEDGSCKMAIDSVLQDDWSFDKICHW